MTLEEHFKSLGLDDEVKRHVEKREVLLSVDEEGRIITSSSKESASEMEKFQRSINKLFEINKLNPGSLSQSHDIDNEVKLLVEEVNPLIRIAKINPTASEAQKQLIEEFLQTMSLAIANFIVNDLIKTDIESHLIEKMVDIYVEILKILKEFETHNKNYLLSRTSLISPLLITISFSYKMQSFSSSKLIKILAVLLTYMINHEDLLHSITKMFVIGPSTNIEMFHVFNKLWESTLEVPIDIESRPGDLPGPITISNRIDMVQGIEISTDLLENIIPYSPSQFIRQLLRSTLKINSILSNIQNRNKVSKNLLELVGFVSDDLSCETMLVLMGTLGMQETMLKLFDGEEYTSELGYVFSKISQTSSFAKSNNFIAKLHQRTINKDITTQMETSIHTRYKVLLEVIDHNLTIDFQNEASWSILLGNSLYYIDKEFNFEESHSAIYELGSSVSLSAMFIYITYILSDSILKSINPSRDAPKQLKTALELKKFPPLPKSSFLDFKNNFLTSAQLNVKNYQRIVNSLHHCLSILHKLNVGYKDNEDWLHPIKDIEDRTDHWEYQALSASLDLYYSALYFILVLSDELLQKSRNYGDENDYSPIFIDLSSTSQILKLQVMQSFEDIFHIYDTFAFFKLVKFIMKISMTDLELQKFSLKILNHSVFDSDNGLQDKIFNNDLIKTLLTQYIALWDDGSKDYQTFETMLGIRSGYKEVVIFDYAPHLKALGIDESLLKSPSPAATSTTSTSISAHSSLDNYGISNNNMNNNNNINNNNINFNNTDASTPPSFNSNSLEKFQSHSRSFFGNSNYTAKPQQWNNNNHNNNNNNNNFHTNNFNNNYNTNNRFVKSSGSITTGGGMDHNYKNSNIRNVQSFVPQNFIGQNNNNRTQTIHIDQFQAQ